MKTAYEVYPVGYVRRTNDSVYVEIEKKFRSALLELENFSHIQVLWWCHSFDEKKFREMTQFDPPFEAPRLGIFASRAPMRPNPIAISKDICPFTAGLNRRSFPAGLRAGRNGCRMKE